MEKKLRCFILYFVVVVVVVVVVVLVFKARQGQFLPCPLDIFRYI